jgi:hypothetical protein
MALGQVRVRLDKRSSEEGAGGSATLLQRVEVLFERGPSRVRINLEQELLTRGGEPLDRTVTSLRTADLAFGALLEHLEEKGVRFRWMVTPSTSYLQLHVPEDLLYGS